MKYLLFLPIFLAILISCNSETIEETAVVEVENALGVLEHDFDLSPETKENFEHGLLLMHSFEYDDAKTAFQEAKEKDSTEVMVYWGEAMSHYKALWGLQDKRAGYAVLEQLGATLEERLAKIEDPLKKDFWMGVEILYGDGSLKDRNEKFNELMLELHKKYPNNQEAAAFYALSLMWDNNRDDDPTEVGKRSADVVKGILSENDLHPGALHYTIHAYDNPIMADAALEVANKYSQVAPDAAHALHMPSHIYLSLGMWPEVVSSNIASYAASVKRMEKLGLEDDARGYHSYAWLHYAYLQQGKTEKAIGLLEDLKTYYEKTQTKGIRSYIASMQSAQLFETGEWPEGLELMEVKLSDLGLAAQMRMAILKAQLAIDNGASEELAGYIQQLADEIEKGELYVSEDKAAMCSAGPSRYAPNDDAISKAKAVYNIMLAMQAITTKSGDPEAYMKKAVDYEWASEYSYGPSDLPLPSFEMYAYWLMEEGRNDEALIQFDKSLERAPNRRNALIGKKMAYEKMGAEDKIAEIDKLLLGFESDKTLTSL